METEIATVSHPNCSMCILLTNAKNRLTQEQAEFYHQFNLELDRLIQFEETIELTLSTNEQTLEELKYEVKAAYNNYLEVQRRLYYYKYLHNFHNAIHHYG